MDILKSNQRDHLHIQELLKNIKNSAKEEKKEAFKSLYAKVYSHNSAEETSVFEAYKARLGKKKAYKKVLYLSEEHKLINYQMSMILRTTVDNETWDIKLSLLENILLDHMAREEKLLKKYGKKYLEEEDLESLAKDFKAAYDQTSNLKADDLNIAMETSQGQESEEDQGLLDGEGELKDQVEKIDKDVENENPGENKNGDKGQKPALEDGPDLEDELKKNDYDGKEKSEKLSKQDKKEKTKDKKKTKEEKKAKKQKKKD